MPEGILQKIEALTGVTVPWTEDNALLDIDYIYRWSGYKSISPLVKHVLGNNTTMPSSGYTTLAGIVWAHFGIPWTKAYNAIVAEYNPIENYDMVEEEDSTITDDADTRVTGSATDNTTSVESTHNVYGYNSSSASPSESDSTSTGTKTDLDTKYDNERGIDRTLTRHGNIGVTTSQQMIESELKLRAFKFFERVFKDIDTLLALPIYDGEISGAIYAGTSGGGSVSVTSVNGKTGEVTLYASDIDLTSMISQSVAEAISALNTQKRNKPTVLTATLEAGQTSVTITNDAIGDDSIIDIYMNKSGVSMTGWNQVGHVFTMSFDSYESDVLITLEVFN